MKVRLSLPPDCSFDAIVRSHGWYDLPPFRYDPDRGELTTVVAGPTSLTLRVSAGQLVVTGGPGLGGPRLRAMARRILSLDLNLDGFGASLASEPALSRALRRGGGRMLRSPTLFEDAVKTLFTTNCSWAATRGMVARLVGLAGDGGAAFPSAAAVARLSPAVLREKLRCGYRAQSLSRFARRVDSGRLDLSDWERRDRPAREIREAILSEHGFGPYAAEGLLRILGRYEYLALDSWIRKKYRQLYPGPRKATDGSIARRYARFGDCKGLALWLDLTRDWHEGVEKLWP